MHRSDWTNEDWNEALVERAGIMEFDGGMRREDANQAAASVIASERALCGATETLQKELFG